jgi:hypothetical protein
MFSEGLFTLVVASFSENLSHPSMVKKLIKAFRLPVYFVLAAFTWAQPTLAAPHKCVGAGGKVEYTDGPCKPGSTEKAIKAKPVTVMKSEAITGQTTEAKAKEKDARPAWLKEANQALDPIAKCKAQGGTIDKEFRACRLP